MTDAPSAKPLGVVYAPGSASIRDLVEVADRRSLQLICVAGRGLEQRAIRILRGIGELVDSNGDEARLVSALRTRGVQGLLTFSDTELIRTSRLADALGLPGLSPGAARVVRSKFAQRLVLNASGCSDIGAVLIEPGEFPEGALDIRYPAVLKPDEGTASRNTFRVENPEQARRAVRDLEEPSVLESLIATDSPVRAGWLGDYVSVESLVGADGEILTVGVTDRFPSVPPFREQGAVVPSNLSEECQRSLGAVAERAIQSLGIRSAAVHTELKLVGDGAVIEVNARMGGYVDALYRKISVTSLIDAAIDLALGRRPRPPAEANGVAAIWVVLAPEAATTVDALPDPRELLALPGVWHVERVREVGDHIEWQSGTSGRVLDVYLEASDHDEARERLDRLQEFLAGRLKFRADGARSPASDNVVR